MKWTLLTFLFAFTTYITLAQNDSPLNHSQIDSVKRVLSQSKEGTIRVKLYKTLACQYIWSYPDTALSYILPGLDLARKVDFKTGEVYLMNYWGEALAVKGNYTKALHTQLQALEKAEALNEPLPLANSHKHLGSLYLRIGDYQKALAYFQKENTILSALKEYKAYKKISLGQIGQCYINLNQLDSAYYYIKQAYDLDVKDKTHWGMPYFHMGNIHEKKGNYDQALHFYRVTNRIVSNRLTRGTGYGGMASVFHKMDKQDSALFYAKKVLDDGLKHTRYSAILIASSLLTDIYKSKGDTTNAFKYLQIMLVAKDSVFSQEKVKYLQNLSFNETQRQQEIEAQQEEYYNKIKLYALLALGAMVVGVILMRVQANLKIKQLESKKLRELDTLKSHFFANISHEFRTPLSLISGTVEKLSHKDKLLSEHKEDYQVISRNSDRLLTLINQLLDLSKLEAGKLELHKQPGEVIQFLKALLSAFTSLFENKGISYVYHLPAIPLPAKFDADKLEKIITNLLSNAYKFTPPQGKVVFSLDVLNQSATSILLQIKVQDSGIGIAEQELPRIFDRFQQVDASATRAYEGTGIGLALVKELVELQAGQITAESSEGKGTLFTVHLPMELLSAEEATGVETASFLISPQQPFHPAEKALATDTLPSTATPTAALHVLIVEDNADLRHFIRQHLSEEYMIAEAQDGLQGYHKALAIIPDLIISDVMMPEMDGVILCEKLKTDERTSHIPLILLTAKADLETKLKGLETGADDYLTKPFKLEELQVRARNLMESRKKLRQHFSKHLTLDPKEITVTSVDEKFLQRALTIVEAHMANADFDIETFSKEIGMSRAHLHRKLTALTDQSASEFIKLIRLKRAASLLKQQHGNISEVAYQVGFSSLNYFTKCFKEYYGQIPSEYMRQMSSLDVKP